MNQELFTCKVNINKLKYFSTFFPNAWCFDSAIFKTIDNHSYWHNTFKKQWTLYKQRCLTTLLALYFVKYLPLNKNKN